jgi:predicted transglutaminase-like cysteine proteinase
VIKSRGANGDAKYENIAPEKSQAADAAYQRTIGDIPRERGVHREAGDIQRLKPGDRLQGTAHRAGGTQPDIVAEFGGPRFEETIGKRARAIGADPALTPEEKLQRVNALVNEHLKPNFDPAQIDELDRYHQGFIDAGRPIGTEDYLRDGLADCRGFAVVHQMALQEAGFQAGIGVSKTVLRDLSGPVPPGLVSEADGLSHYYNVVQVDGRQLIADAFNPAASGNELASALARGFIDKSGQRAIEYLPGRYGATILNDGLGNAFSRTAVGAPVASAEEAAQSQ